VDVYVPDTHTNCSVHSAAFLIKDGSRHRFYVIQVLEQGSSTAWLWRRWGVAGRRGCGLLQGPLQPADAERTFHRLFRGKTKLPYPEASRGAPAVAGHYAWATPGAPLPAAAPALPKGRRKPPPPPTPSAAEWEYLEDPGDGARPERWRRYTREGSALAERLFSGGAGAGAVRSGRFRYELDLRDPANCTQRNADVHPHTVRRIRRIPPA
jgi:predicted DNA-binding WGR domain protein